MGRSLIRSCAKLSYDHAQLMIDNPGACPWGDAMPSITSKPSGAMSETIITLFVVIIRWIHNTRYCHTHSHIE